jgi:hypothetical protein
MVIAGAEVLGQVDRCAVAIGKTLGQGLQANPV